MTRFTITIKDPTGTYPDVVIDKFDKDGFRRSNTNEKTFAGYTANSAMLIEGPTGGVRYSWQISCILTELESLYVDEMCFWQNDRYDAGQDGGLPFIDEFAFVPPSANKTLILPTLSLPILVPPFSKTYGFGQFKVKIDRPPEHCIHWGVDNETNKNLNLYKFAAYEDGDI